MSMHFPEYNGTALAADGKRHPVGDVAGVNAAIAAAKAASAAGSADHEARIDALETDVAAIDVRVGTAEGHITTLTSHDADHETRIAALEA